MRKKQRPNIYVPAVTNELKGLAVGFIIWGLLLFAAISAYAFMLNAERLENDKFQTDQLDNVTGECLLKTIVHFDKEPVDFVIKSPTGTRYSSDGCDGYVVDMDLKTITMSVHTKDTGTWTIDYNQKSNKSLQIGTEQEDPEELYITRVILNHEQKLFSFMVCYDSTEFFDIPMRALAQMTSPSRNQTLTLFDDAVEVNEQNRVELTDNQIPYADDWILTISTYEDLSVSRYTPDESDDDSSSNPYRDDGDEGQTLHSIDDMPVIEPTPTPNPLVNHVDGLNVSTYDGPTDLKYVRTNISIKETDHDTTY